MKGFLNLGDLQERTRAEGPGERFALWVQGCLKRCQGCCNQPFQELRPNKIIPLEQVWAWISETHAQSPLHGITLLGGEPFLQSEQLAQLAQKCQEAGLTVIAFSGYTLEELKTQGGANNDLIAHCDLLIDGDYRANEPDNTRPLVGSRNQLFHFLSERISKDFEFDRDMCRVEIHIGESMHLHGDPRMRLGVNSNTAD